MFFVCLFLFRVSGKIQDVQTICCKNEIFMPAVNYRVTMNFLGLLLFGNYVMSSNEVMYSQKKIAFNRPFT